MRNLDTSSKNNINSAFLKQLREYIEANLNNEQFGVEELAQIMKMSRFNLYRKLQQTTGKSINQFIREYRLQRALELLKNESMTASEIAFQVGFSSATYFNKCFTEYYGYTPGEARRKLTENKHDDSSLSPVKIMGSKTSNKTMDFCHY